MNRSNRTLVVAFAASFAAAFSISASLSMAAVPSKQAPIMTKWAAEVDRDKPWPEYPRPQLVRKDWLNLNGTWQFEAGKENDASPFGHDLADQILVPFPPESALSGVMKHSDRMWYRRTFAVPAAWHKGDIDFTNIMLNFGAVDYDCEVFVNGKSVGSHKGGYDPFSFDIRHALKFDGKEELVVRVFDPTNDGGQPRGKQSVRPGGIMYTPTSGIWQTVWLEPIPHAGIDHLRVKPNVDDSSVEVAVEYRSEDETVAGPDVVVAVKDGDRVVATASGQPGDYLKLNIPNAKLWSPQSPFLYTIEAKDGFPAETHVRDSVISYFGMRKISLGEENGIKKIFLNNKFLFQIGPLDQGFWPDGLYTPPTEAAMKNDIQTMKDLGFNMVRKHIKVEPARWYYWTDHLGLLVWQDMPSANSYDDHPTPPVDKDEYKSELRRMVTGLQNVPSIVQWEIFNEGQGQHDTKKLVDIVKQLDPTRLVNQASGGDYFDAGDVYDIHSYPPPRAPEAKANMALAVGEYGGIGLMVNGHLWAGTNGGYTNVGASEELIERYAEFTNMLKGFRDNDGLSAAVYTQITDVETELNGLLTYDRVPKMDIAQIAKANHFELPPPTYKALVATSETDSQTWKYTFDKPADAWTKSTFDDKAWKEGKGGFGTTGTPGMGQLGTEWNTPDVWLRRTFQLNALSTADLQKLVLRNYHDEDLEVFINGVKAYEAQGFNGRYENRKLSHEALAALKPGAENVFAVHCKQTVGGQYVDVGLSVREPGK